MKKAIILGTLLCSSLLVGCSNKKENNSTKRETKLPKVYHRIHLQTNHPNQQTHLL